jgi:hypothetical protein
MFDRRAAHPRPGLAQRENPWRRPAGRVVVPQRARDAALGVDSGDRGAIEILQQGAMFVGHERHGSLTTRRIARGDLADCLRVVLPRGRRRMAVVLVHRPNFSSTVVQRRAFPFEFD